MNTPLVTIGIPTYNRAGNHLRDAIENALGQTYPNLDVLVSDNCSSDNTPEIVGSFSDPRLRFVRQEENLGLLGNANYLVNEARGEFMLMLHDDDRIDPDFVEVCIKAAGDCRDVGLIVTGARVIDGDGKVLRGKDNPGGGMSTDEFILLWYRQRVHLFFCCCMFGTETLRKVGGFDPKYGTFIDVAAEFLCAANGRRIDVREQKADFREHAGSNTSASKLSEWCTSSLALLDLACSLAGEESGELRSIGLRTSADRNYRYAVEATGRLERLRRMWTVFRHFGFQQVPERRYLKQVLSNSQ